VSNEPKSKVLPGITLFKESIDLNISWGGQQVGWWLRRVMNSIEDDFEFCSDYDLTTIEKYCAFLDEVDEFYADNGGSGEEFDNLVVEGFKRGWAIQ